MLVSLTWLPVDPRTDLYHVRPVHKLARRCNLDRANGFEMLKSQLQDSNQRVKAMRSGNTSIFHMGGEHGLVPLALH